MLRRSKKHIFCRNCGKKHYPCFSSMGIYCSLLCQHEYQRKKLIERWFEGELNPVNSNGVLRPWARRYIFDFYDSKCSKCGWRVINRFTKKIPLEVHHIDGNFKNNKLNNLRLLCPNCHSLTSTFKNSNKGKGRKGRISGIVKM